jgi:hypothetical protein
MIFRKQLKICQNNYTFTFTFILYLKKNATKFGVKIKVFFEIQFFF